MVHPPHVLLVDSEEPARTAAELALEAAGCRVETAAGGSEALLKFETGTGWDLVLLDQPRTGTEALRTLRRLRERNAAAPVVLVADDCAVEVAVEAMKASAADVLRKPLTPVALRQVVRGLLARPRGRSGSFLEIGLSASAQRREPLIHFRTLNGYKFWPIPLPQGGEETEALRIRRAFEVEAPSGEIHRCAVDLTTTVRNLVREQIERDPPADDPIWDTVCKSGLSNFLWEKADLPPDTLLVYGLTREQLETVRALAGVSPGGRW